MRGRKRQFKDAMGLTIWIDTDSWWKLQELKEKTGKSISKIVREALEKQGLI